MMLALIGAALIGLSLGLLGSGGSILTVPILVYLVGESEKLAIAESLAIVGGISLVGALPYVLQNKVHWHSIVWFGIPGVLGTYLGATLSQFVSGAFQLLLFAAVMILAAVFMFKGSKPVPADSATTSQDTSGKRSPLKIILEGLSVGTLTGLVGVGGGFLIIPALVLLGGLPMSIAIGTSLLIIAVKSFAGFYKYLHLLEAQNITMNWKIIVIFTVLGIAGSFVGARLSSKISNNGLKKGFASFLVVMGIYVLSSNMGKI